MTPESLERSLREHPFVAPLGEAVVRFLVGCTKNARVDPGGYLGREGEPADAVYLLRSGQVALQSHVPGRGTVVLETLDAGDALGFSVLCPPHRWSVDVRATAPTVAFAVDGECLRGKVRADAGFGLAITQRLLVETHRRLVRCRLQQLDAYRAADP